MSKQQPINHRGNSEEEFASKSYNGGFIMCTHDTAQTLPLEPIEMIACQVHPLVAGESSYH